MDISDGFKLPVSRRGRVLALHTPRQVDKPTRASKELLRDVERDEVDVVAGAFVGSRRSAADGLGLPDRLPFSTTDIVFVLFSILTFLADIGTDLKLAHSYYSHEDWIFFGLTLGFFVLSGAVSSAFSMYWYLYDFRSVKDRSPPSESPTKGTWFIRGLCAVLLISPVLRYVDVIRYGLWGRARKLTPEQRATYFREMQYERVDGAMLRLFECFMEDAPQLVLQLYVVLSHGFPSSRDEITVTLVFQALSIVTSLVSLAWGQVAYHKALRYSRSDRRNLSHIGFVFQFLWRLFEVAPRVLAFAVFMLAQQYWLAVLVGCHWVVMAAWLLSMGSKFCPKLKLELLFVLVVAAVWVFCHFNIKDGATRRRYVMYYAIMYVENIAMAIVWYISVDGAPLRMQWHNDVIMPVILGSFWVGIFFMLIYYSFFHPNRPLPNTLPCSYWLSCDDQQQRKVIKAEIEMVDGKIQTPNCVSLQPSVSSPGADAAGMVDESSGAKDPLLPTRQERPASSFLSLLSPSQAAARLSLSKPQTLSPRPRSSSMAMSASDSSSVRASQVAVVKSHADITAALSPAVLSRPLPTPPRESTLPMSRQEEQLAALPDWRQQQADNGYLKPLIDGYCNPDDVAEAHLSGGFDNDPVATQGERYNCNASDYILPPAYHAPVPAVPAEPDAYTAWEDDITAAVPSYPAPPRPSSAMAEDLEDMPAYHAPPRPHSTAMELDGVPAQHAPPPPPRPHSAIVERYRAVPVHATLPSLPHDASAHSTGSSSSSAKEKLPGHCPVSHCDSIVAPLRVGQAERSPMATDTTGMLPSYCLDSLSSTQAAESVPLRTELDEPAPNLHFEKAADGAGDSLPTTPLSRQSPERDELPLQTPDRICLQSSLLDCVTMPGSESCYMLLTPDIVGQQTDGASPQMAGDGSLLLTPEAYPGHVHPQRLRYGADAILDLDLTPDRKLLAMGIGRSTLE